MPGCFLIQTVMAKVSPPPKMKVELPVKTVTSNIERPTSNMEHEKSSRSTLNL
jgi:hypothetical protein